MSEKILKEHVSVSMNADIYEKIKEIAEKKEEKIAAVVEKIIEDHLSAQ